MAGIGPISKNIKDLLKRAGYRNNPTQPANELEIFLNLCVGRVYYRQHNRTLYFVDSPALSISQIIQTVFRGIDKTAHIKQLYMDEHKLIKSALCITLTPKQKKLIMVALSMNGIFIHSN